jgi:hypothetical protein
MIGSDIARQKRESLGAVRANRGIPRDLEGEGKSSKKEKSAFQRSGDVMVQEWNDRTFVNDKYDPRCNNSKQREGRQENKHGNKKKTRMLLTSTINK